MQADVHMQLMGQRILPLMPVTGDDAQVEEEVSLKTDHTSLALVNCRAINSSTASESGLRPPSHQVEL